MGSIKETIIILFLFFLLFSILPLYSEDESTIFAPLEELYTENAFIREIKEKALSDDNYLKSMALYLIEKTIQNEAFVPVRNELLCILYHLCTHRDSLKDEKSDTRIRKKAIDLIGRLGEKTRDTEYEEKPADVLLSLLHEDDIGIVSCTVFSLGKIGCNNEGKTIKAIALAVDKWTLLSRDQTFALAVITSIEKIACINKGIKEPEVYTTLIKIMQSTTDIKIIGKAFEVMDTLNSYE